MLSYLVTYSRHIIVIGLAVLLFVFLSREPNDRTTDEETTHVEGTNERLFTEQELTQYDGSEGSKGIFLVILGYVYDVSSGIKHYGPGEAYNMFVGHDATRSFITGEFEEFSSELSDVSSLTGTELMSLVKWKSFYDKTYQYRGKLIGRYFDERGDLTEYHKLVLEKVAIAEAEDGKPKQEYPLCNVEWKEETGTKVWCTSRSGDGLERGWVGKPRRYVKQEDKTPFCVCVPDEVESDALEPFDNCDREEVDCYAKDNSEK
ncbi:neuferricin homolog [Toxorhynchites rutilus septentrionalis]|uniref:neuferricin homolog n=1 Tax=Toxorhynchites rutilus septentrionalis TaxID=329112 RepID=UPI00247A72C9|nr:neuferricin homolog [Toxorhynchites rutilus septentrionalis]XP_055615721.1 neuferricin homolog [Toxorhynchites rutilus septentrionalis]